MLRFIATLEAPVIATRLAWFTALVLLAGCGGGGGDAPSPSVPQPRVVTFPIASTFTGQTYDVTVLLPIGYDTTATRSPVIYALDGTDRYARLAQPLGAQKYENVVMVSISANGRPRRFIDFSMPGAAPYNRFLSEELIPKIDREYHTDTNFRVLTGHSLSAEFALFSLYMEPADKQTFRSYIVNDCSCWVNTAEAFLPGWELPIEMLDALYARKPVLPVKVWMGSSAGTAPLSVYQRISMRGFQGLDIKYTAYAFDHVAMDGPSFAESLAFVLGPPVP